MMQKPANLQNLLTNLDKKLAKEKTCLAKYSKHQYYLHLDNAVKFTLEHYQLWKCKYCPKAELLIKGSKRQKQRIKEVRKDEKKGNKVCNKNKKATSGNERIPTKKQPR